MSDHEVKFAAIFELCEHALWHIIVHSVKVADFCSARPSLRRGISEPLAELGFPNFVTKENDACFGTQLAMQLVKNVILGEDSGNEVLGKLKYGVDDTRKETFDTHNGYGGHLRS